MFQFKTVAKGRIWEFPISLKRIFLPFILLTSFYSCSQTIRKEDNYPEQVGDISFDKDVDDPNFKVCNENRILQYYNFGKGLQYKGEKSAINQYFNEKLKPKEQAGESGFLTIRFVVNCDGKTEWFRIHGMDNNYKGKTFNKDLVDTTT